jgi:hypothetical protein
LTSLTVDECAALGSPFEAAFLGDRAAWTLQGRRRPARRYTTDKHCPLPTPEDRRLVVLVDLKQKPPPLLHGGLCAMRPSKATPGMHVLLPGLRNTVRTVGDAPCRHVEARRAQWGRAEPLSPAEVSRAEEGQAAPPAAVPRFVMTVPRAPSRAPRTRLNRKLAIAASTSGTG